MFTLGYGEEQDIWGETNSVVDDVRMKGSGNALQSAEGLRSWQR